MLVKRKVLKMESMIAFFDLNVAAVLQHETKNLTHFSFNYYMYCNKGCRNFQCIQAHQSSL